MSHTVTVKIELKDRAALVAAVTAMQGKILGDGKHQIEGRYVEGFGFTMPEWYDTAVLQGDATLAYNADNDYLHPQALPALKGKYAVERARQTADAQGWMSYDESDGSLVISHPNGGTMTVLPDGTVDSVGFIGDACNVAQVIENSIGTPGDRRDKPEFYQGAYIQL